MFTILTSVVGIHACSENRATLESNLSAATGEYTEGQGLALPFCRHSLLSCTSGTPQSDNSFIRRISYARVNRHPTPEILLQGQIARA
jgi:hypothetical protein